MKTLAKKYENYTILFELEATTVFEPGPPQPACREHPVSDN